MGKKTEFLYLSEPDMIKAGVLDSAHCVNVIDEVFRLLGTGDYIMGGIGGNEHGLKINFPVTSEFPNMPLAGPDRRFMSMVAYLGGRFNVCGEKWYGSNVANPARGLPRSVLMCTLNDPDTCEPLCQMSANLISAVRTGAVPGVGVRYLARKNAEVCTVIGAGPVNKACFQAIAAEAKNLKEVVVYDLFPDKAQQFVDFAKNEVGIEGRVVTDLQSAVELGDIVSVAASRIKPVELKDEWLKKGSLMILTGPAKADDAYWLNAKIVFDNEKMHMAYMNDAIESGDVQGTYNGMIAGQVYRLIDEKKLPPLTQATSLGEVILGKKQGRQSDDEKMVFITGGMAVLDVGWGKEIYDKAVEMGLGTKLLLWEEAHWT